MTSTPPPPLPGPPTYGVQAPPPSPPRPPRPGWVGPAIVMGCVVAGLGLVVGAIVVGLAVVRSDSDSSSPAATSPSPVATAPAAPSPSAETGAGTTTTSPVAITEAERRDIDAAWRRFIGSDAGPVAVRGDAVSVAVSVHSGMRPADRRLLALEEKAQTIVRRTVPDYAGDVVLVYRRIIGDQGLVAIDRYRFGAQVDINP